MDSRLYSRKDCFQDLLRTDCQVPLAGLSIGTRRTRLRTYRALEGRDLGGEVSCYLSDDRCCRRRVPTRIWWVGTRSGRDDVSNYATSCLLWPSTLLSASSVACSRSQNIEVLFLTSIYVVCNEYLSSHVISCSRTFQNFYRYIIELRE